QEPQNHGQSNQFQHRSTILPPVTEISVGEMIHRSPTSGRRKASPVVSGGTLVRTGVGAETGSRPRAGDGGHGRAPRTGASREGGSGAGLPVGPPRAGCPEEVEV